MTLRQRRKQAGLTQKSVAQALEVDQSAVSLWEKGPRPPLLKYQRKLAALYGCTVDELLTDEKESDKDDG